MGKSTERLAVLALDEGSAVRALSDALASVREPWDPKTTARNLQLIRGSRERRRTVVPWAKPLEEALERRASQ